MLHQMPPGMPLIHPIIRPVLLLTPSINIRQFFMISQVEVDDYRTLRTAPGNTHKDWVSHYAFGFKGRL